MFHEKYKHKGLKYQCDKCEYASDFPTMIKIHKKSCLKENKGASTEATSTNETSLLEKDDNDSSNEIKNNKDHNHDNDVDCDADGDGADETIVGNAQV